MKVACRRARGVEPRERCDRPSTIGNVRESENRVGVENGEIDAALRILELEKIRKKNQRGPRRVEKPVAANERNLP